MTKTIKEYTTEKVAAAAKAKSQDLVPGAVKGATDVTETEDSKNATITTKFFQALAAGGQGMGEAQKSIQEQYKAKSQSIAVSTEGGILVPLTVDQNIQQQLDYISPMRQIARVISNAPANLQLPSASGGDAYWVAEQALITETQIAFAAKNLVPSKLASRIKGISIEFLQDVAINPSAQALLESRLAQKAALVENAAFVNGDGANKPFGFRSASVTPLSVAVATAMTLTWSDLVNAKFKLPTAIRGLGVWVLPSTALKNVIGMKDSAGRPIFLENITEGGGATLLGRPCYIVDEIPTTGTTPNFVTEIWYGLFSDYVIGDRLGTTFDLGTSNDDFDRAVYTLRMLKRVGGVPTSNNFVKLTGVPAV